MKTSICLVLALTFPINSYADCAKPVTLLEQGASAPCRGYLFTPEEELQVRIIKKNSLLDQQEIEGLNNIVDRLQKKDSNNEAILKDKDQQIDLWKVRAEDSTLKLVKYDENKQTRDALLVGSGFLLAMLSAWAWSRVK